MVGTVAAVMMAIGGASAQQADAQQGAVQHSAARQSSEGAGFGTAGQPVRQVATVSYPATAKKSASFDISRVDPATQTYYLADRTNSGVDAVDAARDTFTSIIGAGDFTGTGANATAAQAAACGPTGTVGPDGVLSLNVGGVRQLWAGNGVDATSQARDRERLGSAWLDTGLVFTTKTGRPVEPRNLVRSFARICDGSGIRRIRVHALRHTTASLLKALGVPAKDAQVILGHAHISTTQQIYTHVDEAARLDAVTRMNTLFGGGE